MISREFKAGLKYRTTVLLTDAMRRMLGIDCAIHNLFLSDYIRISTAYFCSLPDAEKTTILQNYINAEMQTVLKNAPAVLK